MTSDSRHVLQKSKSRRDVLLDSVREGDWKQVLGLLRHTPEGSSLGRQGEMLIHEAVMQSEIAILDFLLDRGVSPIATDSTGQTPLHLAAIYGHEHIVQHLIKKAPEVRQNINQVSHNGLTAYQAALTEGHTNLASALEKHGASPKPVPGLRQEGMENGGADSKGYTDWAEVLFSAQNHLDQSLEELKLQISQVKQSVESAFQVMNTTMSQLVGKQEVSDTRLKRLQKKLTDVEQEVKSRTQELNEGVKTLVNNTNELRTTIRQAGEFNEYVYFRIFNRISQKVGMEKNCWRKLNTALLEDYPESLLSNIEHEIRSHHTSEKDMAFESLTKWNLYNKQRPQKIESLKRALHRSDIEHLLRDINEVLQEYEAKVPAKPSACTECGASMDRWLSKLDSSCWLSHVKDVLTGACVAAQCVDKEGASVLVHGSEGTDSTLQVTSLAQLILDPDCRTIRGFEALVEREWLQAGHPFTDRCSKSAFAVSKNRTDAPTFLLFLDCVWQIWQQFSLSFEFNEEFLVMLFEHAYASQFGTFLCNSDLERRRFRLDLKSVSLWSYVNRPEILSQYMNPLYEPNRSVIWPSVAPHSLQLWDRLYQRFQHYQSSSDSMWEEIKHIKETDSELKSKVIKMRKQIATLEKEALDTGLIPLPAE